MSSDGQSQKHHSNLPNGNAYDESKILCNSNYYEERNHHQNTLMRRYHRPSKEGSFSKYEEHFSQVRHTDTDRRAQMDMRLNERRTLLKHNATDEARQQSRHAVVMCRYNPTHILDLADINSHESSCEDRGRLELFGCSFKNRGIF